MLARASKSPPNVIRSAPHHKACPDYDAFFRCKEQAGFAGKACSLSSLSRSRPLVAQDGLERLRIPWNSFDALFIGGTTEWKLGAAARAIARDASLHSK